MKKIAILGSTGSIGQNALEVIRHFPDRFSVAALSTNSNIELLHKQIEEFHPKLVCVGDPKAAMRLKRKGLACGVKLFTAEDGLAALVQEREVQKVLLAVSGSSALSPLIKAIESKKEIALANKEALVMAGPIIMSLARKFKIKILPVDSEESAIWQCLEGRNDSKLKKIHLTASGGPFWQKKKKDLKGISISSVLKHPRWKMGRKITVDSANLMNKGLELLETMFLFDVGCDRINIIIHPEAIIHSMVEFADGSVIAQLSAADMRIPIQYALSYPQRLSNSLPLLDFYKLKGLHFEKPDFGRFPCLGLAFRAAKELGTLPAVLNAANEVCVEKFLEKKISFVSIPKVIENVLDSHNNRLNPDLDEVKEADIWARSKAKSIINLIK